MVEVKLLKSFGSWAKGTVRAVSLQRAKYWKRIGLAEKYVKPKKKEKKKDTENDKPRNTSKSKK